MMRDTAMFSESNYWTADLALSSLAIVLLVMLAGKSIVGFLRDACNAGYSGAMILRWSASQRGGVGQVAPEEDGEAQGSIELPALTPAAAEPVDGAEDSGGAQPAAVGSGDLSREGSGDPNAHGATAEETVRAMAAQLLAKDEQLRVMHARNRSRLDALAARLNEKDTQLREKDAEITRLTQGSRPAEPGRVVAATVPAPRVVRRNFSRAESALKAAADEWHAEQSKSQSKSPGV